MKIQLDPRGRTGVSLLELLVAITVGMLLILVMAAMTNSALQWSTRIHDGLSIRRDGKVALDYFERDISTVTAAEPGRMTLALVPEKVAGTGGVAASSCWIMLLSRPAASADQGAIRTISYRLVYTDPMTPGGEYPRFALYRTSVIPEPKSGNEFLRASDLHGDYWLIKWPDYIREASGRTLLDDYLLENVVDFQATVNYTYRDEAGNRMPGESIPGRDVYWTSQGFSGEGVAADQAPNVPVSVTLTITALNAHGVSLCESGEMPFDEIIAKEGITLHRTFPIHAR